MINKKLKLKNSKKWLHLTIQLKQYLNNKIKKKIYSLMN